MPTTSPDKLIEEIVIAFAGVKYPGDDRLTDSTYGEEPAALVEEFRGKHDWRELDPAFLNQAPDGWASALSFFSNEAFKFYLPAYLIADLRGQLTSPDPSSQLCISVTPLGGSREIAKVWGGGTMGERAREKFSSFDARQVAVIVEYLKWRLESSADDITIEQALNHYWLKRNYGT